MSIAKNILAFVAFLCLLSGCSEDIEAIGKKADRVDSSTVIAVLNDVSFTSAMLENGVNLRMALMKLAGGKINKKDEARKIDQIKSDVYGRFIQTTLLKGVAKKFWQTNSVMSKADGALVASVTSAYDTRIVLPRAKANSFSEVKACLKDVRHQADFQQMRDDDIFVETFLQTAYSNRLSLTDAAVSNAFVRMHRYNERVVATNKLNLATANKVVSEIKKGVPFEDLVERYSQDPEKRPGGELGVCVENEFSDEEGYWSVVSKLREGECSDVIETSVGWEVVKRLPKTSDEGDDPKAIKLARVYLRRGMSIKDYTPEEYRKEHEMTQRQNIIKSLLELEWKSAKFSLPNGFENVPKTFWEQMPGHPKRPQ